MRAAAVPAFVGEVSAPVKVSRSESTVPVTDAVRVPTGVKSLDVALGGGFERRSAVLVSGVPGGGKSSLVAKLCSEFPGRTCYVCGEEAPEFVSARMARTGCWPPRESMLLLEGGSVEALLRVAARERCELVVIDSAQVYATAPDESRALGRACLRHAMATGAIVVIICRMTKKEGFFGAQDLEHEVNVYVWLDGETADVRKNRNGPKGSAKYSLAKGVIS